MSRDRVIAIDSTLALRRALNLDRNVGILEENAVFENPRQITYAKDDFGVGQGLQTGELPWGYFFTGSGSGINLASESGRPGIIRLQTGTTSGSFAEIFGEMFPNQNLLPADSFDSEFMVRVNQTGTGQIVRVGWMSDPTANPSDDGIYFELLSADTNWFAVTRAASVQTRTDTGVAQGTSFVRFRIRRVDGSTIGFTVDSNAEITVATNVPTAVLNPQPGAIRNSAAANKTLDLDYISWLITGLSR